MIKIHKGLTLERWFKFSFLEQLGNIGMDVCRAIRWKKRGEVQLSQQAFERALELISLTVVDPKNKFRLKEILRAREAFIDFYMGDNIYDTTEDFWDQYYHDFSYASAIQRGR